MIPTLEHIWNEYTGNKNIKHKGYNIFVDINHKGFKFIKCVNASSCKTFRFTKHGLKQLNQYLLEV
jgi:hypothetical protein